jgi:predicted deacylase
MIGTGVRYGKHYPGRLSYEEFVDAMADLARAHPALTLRNEGPCSDGRAMWSLSLGDESNPTLYVGASIHGWEWENAYGVLRFAELLAEQPDVEGLDTGRLHFQFMPIQNPWGHEHFTRQNARGVDLNRNFDCAWEALPEVQDVATPWDYNYKGPRAASERETQAMQRIVDRCRPLCLVDFHTADYGLICSHKVDETFVNAIHANIKGRLKDRFLCQHPGLARFQQVNMDEIVRRSAPLPYLIAYAAERGTPAAFVIEMSGNRDGMHAILMNVETVVEICLAATHECLGRIAKA